MAIPAVITGGIAVYQGYQQIKGGAADAERLAANQAAYSKATAGDVNALAFLEARSVQNVVKFVVGYGEIGGWATQTARDDARAKYEAAKGFSAAVDTVGNVVGPVAQGIAQATGHTIVPGTKQDLTIWLIVGLVVVFFAARKFKFSR